MKVDFGMHRGCTVEELLVRYLEYVRWLTTQRDLSYLGCAAAEEACRLEAIFDQTPFRRRRCRGTDCSNTPTHCSVDYRAGVIPYYWCDKCSPFLWPFGADDLYEIRTYRDALRHLIESGIVQEDAAYELLGTLADAKALPRMGPWPS